MTATRRLALTGMGLCTVVAMMLVLAASSWADRPSSGAGEGQITSVAVLDSREAGTNRIEERRLVSSITGTLDGTVVEEVRGVVGADGQVRFQGTGVFVGSLEGCGSGTVNLRLNGRGQAGQAPGLPATVTKFRVVDQASNTLAATGHGTIRQEGLDLEYEFQFVCRE